MPTSIHINEQLGLRVQLHTGSVGHSEIADLIRFYQSDPKIFVYDVVQILEETTAFDLSVEELPAIKRGFRSLVEAAKLPLILRSAWICPSPRAWNILEAWLHERHSLDGLHTEPCLVATLDEASPLFDQTELRAIRNMTGFRRYHSI